MPKITILFSVCFSIFAGILYFIYNPNRIIPVEYNFVVGQIADHDIVAPFDFDVFKLEEVVKREQQLAQEKISPVYKVSDVLTFNSLKNLDFIFKPFYTNNNFLDIKNILHRNAFFLSDQTINALMETTTLTRCYHYLSDQLAYIFNIGIIPADYATNTIIISKEQGVITYNTKQLFKLSEAKKRILEKAPVEIPPKVLEELFNTLLVENIVIDEEKTNIERYKAKENVPLTDGKVLKNELIIGKNQKVTAEDFRKMESLIKYQSEMRIDYNMNKIMLSALGFFLISLFILVLYHKVLQLFFDKEFMNYQENLILYIFLFLPILFTILFHHYFELSILLIPYSLSIIIITYIYQAETSFFLNILLMIYISFFLNWVMVTPLILSLSNAGVILSIKKLKYKQNDFFNTFFLIASAILVHLIFSLLRNESISLFLRNILFSSIGIITSIIIAALIITVLQKKLNIASKENLFQLTDFDHPLLRKMQKLTPGTYHHSIIVGNLAESAAEAIGADHLLARVGSYFHDVGKMENAKFFIENDFSASELHEQLMPFESVKIIKNHVQDGVNLALKEALPRNVISIIQQHHGTSIIRYFYHKAKEANLIIDEKDFCYEGPKPQNKEAAIVMIADIIESTTKSLKHISEEMIQKVLDDTISRLIIDNQLNEAPITLQELEHVKKAMKPILLGIYRKRIEYPE